jgi:hypothetical protein
VRGRGGLVLVYGVFVLDFLGFLGSSIGVMVKQILMMFLGIMVSLSMPLLFEGVADTDQRLVEFMLLE